MAKRRTKRKARKAPATIRKSRKTAKRPAAPVFVRKAAPAPEIAAPAPIVIPRPAPKKRKSQKQMQLEIAEAYRITNQSPYGKTVLTDLFMWCGSFSDVSTNDPIALAKAMERKNMAAHIAKMLGLRDEHFPDEAWRVSEEATSLMGAF